MMDRDGSAFMAGLFLGLVSAAFAVWGATNSYWRTETVERGLALYCPDDGHWAWKGECEND